MAQEGSQSDMNEKSYILDARKNFEDGGSVETDDSYDDMRQLVREEEESGKFTNLPLASFNFINSIIGSGVIGIPYALHQSGFGLGVLLLIIVAVLTDYSLILMVRSGHLCGVMSYQGLMRASFGRPGFYILTILQFIYPFIAMISYNIVVGDTVTKVIIRVTGISESNVFAQREVVILLATLCITTPLCLYKNVAKLAKISFLSLVCVGFILLAIFIRMGTMSSIVKSDDSSNSWEFANIRGIIPSIGIMAFAFMCHHNTFLIYSSIERATQEKWDIVTHWSLFTSFLIAAAFGIAGYVTFTNYVQGDLMENYCWDDDLMNLSRVMFSATILLTFPIECFVTREVIMTAIKGTEEVENHDVYISGSDRRYLLITMGIITTAYLISMSEDCLGVVLELNGILAAVPLAYILPALCYLRLEQGPLLSSQKLPAIGLLLAGAFTAIAGLYIIIFHNDTVNSCKHGQIMPYCLNNSTNNNNITKTLGSTLKPKTFTTTTSATITTLANFISSTVADNLTSLQSNNQSI